MVAIKQVSIPAVVLLSLAEHAVAAPLARYSDIAARDVTSDSLEAIDLATREPGLGKAIKGAASAVKNLVSKNKGKTFDRTLSTANTGMAIANTHKTQQGKRDFEEFLLSERDLEELDERDLQELMELAAREPGIGSMIKGGIKAVGKLIKNNKGKTFDRVLTTANTAMNVANTNKAQKGKRDLEWEALDLATREPGLGKVIKGAASAVKNLVSKNKGKTFDRTLSTANTGMAIANTHKTQQGKRAFEDVEERDFEEELEERDWDEELEERDWDELDERDLEWEALDLATREPGLGKMIKGAASAVKNLVSKNKGKTFDRTLATANAGMTVANTHKAQQGKRDFELELDERDFLEEFEERDIDDEDIELFLRELDERSPGKLASFLKPIVKATKAITGNKGKTFDRVLSTANTGMTIANTHKAQQGKRDFELELDERDFEEEFEERDIDDEDMELFLREIDERSPGKLASFLKPIVKATQVVKHNKGKTFDRVLSTANTAMNVANTNKAQQKSKRDLYELILESRDLEYASELDERDVDFLVRALSGGEETEAEAPAPKVSKKVGKKGSKKHGRKHGRKGSKKAKKAGRTHKQEE